MIELINVTKEYKKFRAVDDLSITFEDKKLTILIGPSGSGKTTTMKMINRIIERTAGDIKVDGESIDDINTIELRRRIGYVIQEIGLFPHMTIYDNIAVVPRLLKWPESKIEKRVKEMLDLNNLEPSLYMKKYPAQLSGGQRQRVGVARGLAADPKILLMDEPFGAIDPINREKLQDSFLDIQDQIQKTIIFVTHDIREAIKLGDKIAILDQGKVVQYDNTMNVLNNPENEFVENLLGSDRALKGLELLKVKGNYDTDYFAISIDERDEIGKIISGLEEKGRTYALVIDGSEKLLGYVTKKDLKTEKRGKELKGYLKPIESVQQNSTLNEAVSLMLSVGLTTLPVINDREKLLGVVRFKNVFEKVQEMANTINEE